jgi:hypothetical protein
MRGFIGLIVLTISFSFNHVAFAQDCIPTCRCGVADVLDSGCMWTELGCGTSGGAFPNCNLLGNHCCYYEFSSCVTGSCGLFYFKKCYVGNCTST